MTGLVRGCALATCLLGLGLGGFGVLSGVRGTFPFALILTLILCGALLVGLGIGLARRQRSRAAWSFTVAILGVLSVTGVLAMPALVRGGLPAVAAGIVLAVVVGLLGSLIAGREAF